MLLELRLQNFRSFRDETVLSLVADSASDHAATHLLDGPGGTKVLRTALIYGANASGKSNVLAAFDVLNRMVADSMNDPKALQAARPFALTKASRDAPVSLGVSFAPDGVCYDYDVTIRKGKVVRERLSYVPEKERLLFERTGDKVRIGPDLDTAGVRLMRDMAQRMPDVLFLSILDRFEVGKVQAVTDWFLDRSRFVMERMTDEVTAEFAAQDPEAHRFVLDVLKSADTGIADLRIDPAFTASTGSLHRRLQEAGIDPEALLPPMPRFAHRGADADAWLDAKDESEGTRALFALAGPLYEVLRHGYVLTLDELGRELHPDLVRKLVELFNTPSVNRKGAQLLAATHETSLLDQRYVRRDSVWFTHKDPDGASRLYPLTDFSPRKGEALRKGYLDGRYGALPVLPRFLFPEAPPEEEAA